MFKCPMGMSFCINKDAKGYFIGVKVEDTPICMLTDYALSTCDAVNSEQYDVPVRLGCTYEACPAKKQK